MTSHRLLVDFAPHLVDFPHHTKVCLVKPPLSGAKFDGAIGTPAISG